MFPVYINCCTGKCTVMLLSYEFLTLKFVLINEGESNGKLPKMFASKKFTNETKKVSCADLIKKRPDGGVLKLDAYAAAKQKIILSWPNECIVF